MGRMIDHINYFNTEINCRERVLKNLYKQRAYYKLMQRGFPNFGSREEIDIQVQICKEIIQPYFREEAEHKMNECIAEYNLKFLLKRKLPKVTINFDTIRYTILKLLEENKIADKYKAYAYWFCKNYIDNEEYKKILEAERIRIRNLNFGKDW